MYQTILIPVDGSDGSEEALRHGIDLARKYDATVHLVAVVDERVFGHYGGVDAVERAEDALAEASKRALADARDRVEAASLPVETHLERAVPHEGIVDAVDRLDADLVVVGTERRSDEYRHLLGSVTERVVRLSPVPVHVVKTTATDESPAAVREAVVSDAEDVRAVAERSMIASFGGLLGADTVADAVGEWYDDEAFASLIADPETVLLVAARDGTVVGFAQSHIVETPAGRAGQIHWLHVDPDHRGEGTGALLFERTREALEARDVDRIDAFVLAAYERGNAFYAARDLERVDSRTVRIGDATYEERVYRTIPPAAEGTPPQFETRTTADGETLYVDYAESEIGTEGPFFVAYTASDRENRFGWFCSNCESFDVAMDTMGRVVCNQCGNRRKATRWDAVSTG